MEVKFYYPIQIAQQENTLPGYEAFTPQAKRFRLIPPGTMGHIKDSFSTQFLCGKTRKEWLSESECRNTKTTDYAIPGVDICKECLHIYQNRRGLAQDRTLKRMDAWNNDEPLTSRHFE